MTDISVKNIKISFEVGSDVLSDVSFDVTEGEHIGILGRNGAGKTTLFRILTGEITSDEGTVMIAPGKRIGVLSQIPDYPDDYTGEDVLKTAHERVYAIGKEMAELERRLESDSQDRELLSKYDRLSSEFLRLGGYELERFRNMVANGLGIPQVQRTQPFSELSGGEKTRLNLARLILEDTEILLLDEPTNHLDMHATEWLENYISSFHGTVLIISHDRFFLDKAVSRIIEIAGGEAEFYSGNYSFYIEEKQRRFEERMRQYEKDQAKLKQLTEAAEKLHLWAFMGNDKLHKRAFSIEKRIEKLSTTDRPVAEKRMHVKFGERDFRGDEVLVAKGLTKSFGGRVLFSDVEFVISPGERIALIGDNGTGKSTLIKIIMNQEKQDSGIIRMGPSIKAAYLPQVVQFNEPELSVLETMMYEGHCTQQTARDRLGAFLFRGEDVFTKVSQLSGGEKSRLRLCILMKNDINFLILDEPTNHLDTASREWVEEALAEFGGTLLFVSHDRYFINRFATRIWEIENGKITDFRGSFERFRAAKEFRAQQLQAQSNKEKTPRQEKQKKKNSYNREKLMARIEREIAALEENVSEIDRLAEEYASDYEKLMELTAEKEKISSELEEKYSQWEELADE